MNEIVDSFGRAIFFLFGWIPLFRRTARPDPLARIPAWSPLGRMEMVLHIADASSGRARKGWAETTRLRPNWRIIP